MYYLEHSVREFMVCAVMVIICRQFSMWSFLFTCYNSWMKGVWVDLAMICAESLSIFCFVSKFIVLYKECVLLTSLFSNNFSELTRFEKHILHIGSTLQSAAKIAWRNLPIELQRGSLWNENEIKFIACKLCVIYYIQRYSNH